MSCKLDAGPVIRTPLLDQMSIQFQFTLGNTKLFGPVKGYSLLDQMTSMNLSTSSVEYVNVL